MLGAVFPSVESRTDPGTPQTCVRRIQKRFKYSRRRAVHDDADIDYINERNMHFNRKIQRYYGEHTEEIKQSLERGTAL